MTGLDQRFGELLDGITTLEALDVPLGDARGCQLAEDVVAVRPMPHFPVCLGPGFAVRAEDTAASVELEVVDEVPAGYAPTAAVAAGTAIRVYAGAPLPPGADTVAPMEQSSAADGVVTITGRVEKGCQVLPEGAVASENQVLAEAGTTVDSRVIGVLASAGAARALVGPRPRVVIVSVGGELRPTGADVKEGLLFDAAGWMLAAAADEAGAVSYRVGPVGDEDRELADAIDDQLVRADLLIVCGGIASPDDSVRRHLEQIAGVHFEDDAPDFGVFGYGTVGDDAVPVVALPDDPARAFMLFTALVRPIICTMLGRPADRLKAVVLSAPVESREGSSHLVLAKTPGGGKAVPLASARPTLMDLMASDLLIRLGPEVGSVPAGTTVAGLPLRTRSTRQA